MKELPSLNSAHIKLGRAVEHLQGLQLEFQRFNDSKPYEIRNERNFDTGQKMLVYYPLGSIPSNWVAVIGEILFNLRSALDLAVYELTVWEKGTPLKQTEFPIFDDEDAFFKLKKNGDSAHGSGLYKIRGLRQDTIDGITSIQPFNTRKLYGGVAFLSLLQEMNIIDKHRELHVCRRLYSGFEARYLKDIPNPDVNAVFTFYLVQGIDLDKRAVLTLFNPVAFDDEMEMDANVPIEIAFDKGSTPGFDSPQKVIYILSSIITCVENVLFHLADSVR